MGEPMYFKPLREIQGRNVSPQSGVKAIKRPRKIRDGLAERVAKFEMFTRSGSGYPKYELVCGWTYRSGEDPDKWNGQFFIDNLTENDAEEMFSVVSEYTFPFVTICQRYIYEVEECVINPDWDVDGEGFNEYRVVLAGDGEVAMQKFDLRDVTSVEEAMTMMVESGDAPDAVTAAYNEEYEPSVQANADE